MIAMKMAFLNTLRNWRQTLATLNAVAIGFIAYILIHGYLVDAKEQFADFYVHRSMYGDLIVEKEKTEAARDANSDPWLDQMDAREWDALKEEIAGLGSQVKGYVSFMPIEGMMASKTQALTIFGFAYDVANGEQLRGERWYWNTSAGQPLALPEKPTILVGKGLAELLGCDITQIDPEILPDGRYKPEVKNLDCFGENLQITALTERSKMNALDVTVGGIVDAGLRSYEDSWVMMPLSQAQLLYDTKRVARVGIGLNPGADKGRVLAELKSRLKARGLPLKIVSWDEHSVADFYRSNIIILETFQNFVLLIVFVICSMTLSSTIKRNIMKRTRDIGSLRALGFKRRFIVILFGWEGFFLGLLGSLIGASIALALSLLINDSGFTYVPGLISQPVPLRIALTPVAYASSVFALSFFSWLIAALVAARRAKENIAESLSHS